MLLHQFMLTPSVHAHFTSPSSKQYMHAAVWCAVSRRAVIPAPAGRQQVFLSAINTPQGTNYTITVAGPLPFLAMPSVAIPMGAIAKAFHTPALDPRWCNLCLETTV